MIDSASCGPEPGLRGPFRARAVITTAFSGEIIVQVRVSEIRFESEIPVVFRSADLGNKIPVIVAVTYARALTSQ